MAKLTLCVLVFVFLFCASQVASETSAFGYGNRFAVICNGDVDDFGWNANVNEGRVAVEAAAMISGTVWLPNIQKEDLETTVDNLVGDGVLVIITTSYGYGNVTEMLAIKYPHVSFAQYGIKSALPNLSDIVFTSLDFYYVVGVFCGATSTNGKVGLVYPGIDVSNINIANTFFMGVKFANPDAEVNIISIGTFDDPDREAGASEVLLDQAKVGSLVGQTNGLTVPKAAMAAGLLAVGMTGYSLSSVFGQQVGMSLLKNWTTSLLPFIPALDGSVVVKKDFTGSFSSGDQIADHRSRFVTDAQWAIVTEAINNMKIRNNTYACGPFVAELGPLKSNGCLNSTTSLNTKLHSEFIVWPDYRVPLEEHKLSSSVTIGLIVTASVLIVATCVLMFIVFLARKRESIRLGSYFFLLNMLIGTILVYGGVIAWPLLPGKHSCLARVWLPSLGGTIAISALIAKNLRIMIAFSYAKQIKKAGAALLLRRFIVIALILVFLDIPFLIAYTVVVPSGTSREQGTNGLDKYDYRDVCASSSSSNYALYALLAYHGVQLLIGCVISYKCRIITDPKYDERKAVAFCLYGIAFCLVVFTVLVGIIGLSNNQLVIGISLALLLVNTFSVVAIFGARIMDLYVQEVDMRLPPQSTNTASMSANMSPSRNTSNSGVSSKEDSSLSF